MANTKISALTFATTPLAGTEVLPIVQSGATTQVSVANLTAGRAVGTGDLTSSGFIKATGNFTTIGFGANLAGYYATNGAGAYRMGLARYDALGSLSALLSSYAVVGIESGATGGFGTGTLAGTFNAGNYIPATAAKGINFTANTPSAGMTSQLLNWYEEGTWTPVVTSQTGSLTSYTSSGRYTRIGRQVTIIGTFKVTNPGTAAGVAFFSGSPFASSSSIGGYIGAAREDALVGTFYQSELYGGGTTGQISSFTNGAIAWTLNAVYLFTITYFI